MKRTVIQTSDGSSTIYVEAMDETYHSSHGAIQEAIHVFIKNGLDQSQQPALTILEIGFGTGLNAMLTALHQNEKQLEYHGLEAYPVDGELLHQLNYTQELGGESDALFASIHAAKWNERVEIAPHFHLKKIEQRIEDWEAEEGSYDLVYFDAFGPRAQQAMWELDVLTKMYHCLKLGGMLVTYCAQGQFKRNLKQLGFEVVALPGPPGKREMTQAFKR